MCNLCWECSGVFLCTSDWLLSHATPNPPQWQFFFVLFLNPHSYCSTPSTSGTHTDGHTIIFYHQAVNRVVVWLWLFWTILTQCERQCFVLLLKKTIQVIHLFDALRPPTSPLLLPRPRLFLSAVPWFLERIDFNCMPFKGTTNLSHRDTIPRVSTGHIQRFERISSCW